MRTDRRKDRWTDMTKFIVAFRNFANAPKRMVMNFQKGSGLELKAFTGLKSEKPKNTEMRFWTPLKLGVINLLWKPPFRFKREYYFFNS